MGGDGLPEGRRVGRLLARSWALLLTLYTRRLFYHSVLAAGIRNGEVGDAVLTVKQAALRMGVSAATVYLLCGTRRLRHTRVGLGRGKISITEEAVEEYLKGREVGPKKPEPPPVPRPRVRFEHLQIPS